VTAHCYMERSFWRDCNSHVFPISRRLQSCFMYTLSQRCSLQLRLMVVLYDFDGLYPGLDYAGVVFRGFGLPPVKSIGWLATFWLCRCFSVLEVWSACDVHLVRGCQAGSRYEGESMAVPATSGLCLICGKPGAPCDTCNQFFCEDHMDSLEHSDYESQYFSYETDIPPLNDFP
jgi:hypothetical protein